MTTYKQPVKELSRNLIWNHAVKTLTSRRNENRILNASYMEHLWLYCQQRLAEKLDVDTFVKWKEFADICYGQRCPENLKVAFFCGNEPENDVRLLLKLGLRIENLYAFENNSKVFTEAVESLHYSYPLLKIYRGKIEDYAELQNTKFDIIYLDFTGTILKEFKTMVKLLDMNALTDMSVLIVNSCYPDKTSENIEKMADFFYNDTFFENSVLDGFEKVREDGDSWFYRAEGCDALGLDYDGIKDKVRTNFECAYSAFQTAFILDYANRHKPSYEVFKQRMLSDRLVKKENLAKLDDFKMKYYDVLLQEYFEDGQRLSSSQYAQNGFMGVKEMGNRVSRLDSMKIAEVFINSPYRHSIPNSSPTKDNLQHSAESRENDTEEYRDVNFKDFLTEEVKQVVEEIKMWFHGQYEFCDMPMEHLWMELLLNQYGHPYHTNINNHRRYSYKAKERRMCLDIITLDKCRALYDWMPMLEYFIHDMRDSNRQMITRMCMDAIDKQLLHIVDEAYFGAALVGINEYEWSKNKVLPRREEIIVEEGKQCSSKSLVVSILSKMLETVSWLKK